MIEKNQVTIQKNSITHRKADWSPLMTKCFVQILAEFDARYQEWEYLHPRNIFGDDDYGMLCEYSFPAEELTKYAHGVDLAAVKTALSKLRSYALTVKGSEDDPKAENSWEEIGILEYNSYNSRTKSFTVRLTHSICPYLVEAKKKGRFTMYSPFIARQFEGKYTERFYEFVCQYLRKTDKDGKPVRSFFLMIDELREMFSLNADGKTIKKDKYRDLSNFLLKVVDPAQQEMKKLYDEESCNVYFTYAKGEKITTGGRPTVDKIFFKIHERMPVQSQAQPKSYNPESRDEMNLMNQKYLEVVTVLKQVFNDDYGKNYLNLVKRPIAKKMAYDRNLADQIIAKIRGIQSNPKVHNTAKYARSILVGEFGILPQK